MYDFMLGMVLSPFLNESGGELSGDELALALESTCSNFIVAPPCENSSNPIDVHGIGPDMSLSPDNLSNCPRRSY
jgi:hypothetical protein